MKKPVFKYRCWNTDEAGQFHAVSWKEADGFIYRSKRFDHRNQHGELGFVLLIVDAVK
ncbi:putative SAM-dependent methyltransferase [Alkalihalobacillus xiaoxiensis]|uniref:SAM-dependent methyltransferase n=1 Tax=Shouchella xiaoxiensis TaxID=766895 RepID=A0ABS2SUM1_9BACI|nr:putative SAM-dependent methyltransferase [Shouchella xiaoxiensis]